MVSNKYKVSNKNEVHWWIKFPDMNRGLLTNCCNPCINSSAPYIICITECYLQNDDNAIIIKILEIALGFANYALSYHKFLYGFYGQNIPKNVILWIITVIVPQIISTWFRLFLIWILSFRVSLLEKAYNYPSNCKATLQNMDKWTTWIYWELWYIRAKTKHTKSVDRF